MLAHASAIAKTIAGNDPARIAGMRDLMSALDSVFDEFVDGHAAHFLDLVGPTLLFRCRRVPEHLRAKKIQEFLAAVGVTEAKVKAAGFRSRRSTRAASESGSRSGWPIPGTRSMPWSRVSGCGRKGGQVVPI